MLRRAFTLIELLVIVAILSVMVSVGVVSITAGQGAARVKGAARDIFGAIRHARSTALVTGQPAIITYSTAREDGEVVAKVEITSAKLFDTENDRSNVETLSGEPLKGEGRELVHIEDSKAEPLAKKADGDTVAVGSDPKKDGGESIEDILFAPMATEVVKGMRVKVLRGDETLADAGTTERKSGVSAFGTASWWEQQFGKAREKQKAEGQKLVNIEGSDAKPFAKDAAAETSEDQEPVSIVWETNGRVEPHQVWVYADGKKPEEGLLIKIDRFGAAKVLPGDGREEDD